MNPKIFFYSVLAVPSENHDREEMFAMLIDGRPNRMPRVVVSQSVVRYGHDVKTKALPAKQTFGGIWFFFAFWRKTVRVVNVSTVNERRARVVEFARAKM